MTKKELELALHTERLANKLLLDKTAELEAKLKEKVMKIGPAQTLPAIHPSFPQYPYYQPIPCNPNSEFERWKTQITCQLHSNGLQDTYGRTIAQAQSQGYGTQ